MIVSIIQVWTTLKTTRHLAQNPGKTSRAKTRRFGRTKPMFDGIVHNFAVWNLTPCTHSSKDFTNERDKDPPDSLFITVMYNYVIFLDTVDRFVCPFNWALVQALPHRQAIGCLGSKPCTRTFCMESTKLELRITHPYPLLSLHEICSSLPSILVCKSRRVLAFCMKRRLHVDVFLINQHLVPRLALCVLGSYN